MMKASVTADVLADFRDQNLEFGRHFLRESGKFPEAAVVLGVPLACLGQEGRLLFSVFLLPKGDTRKLVRTLGGNISRMGIRPLAIGVVMPSTTGGLLNAVSMALSVEGQKTMASAPLVNLRGRRCMGRSTACNAVDLPLCREFFEGHWEAIKQVRGEG